MNQHKPKLKIGVSITDSIDHLPGPCSAGDARANRTDLVKEMKETEHALNFSEAGNLKP